MEKTIKVAVEDETAQALEPKTINQISESSSATVSSFSLTPTPTPILDAIITTSVVPIIKPKVQKTPGVDIFEGRLELFGGLGRTSDRFKLIKDRRRVCIITGNPLKLRQYLHKNVRVEGVTVAKVYGQVPFVRVKKTELVSQ